MRLEDLKVDNIYRIIHPKIQGSICTLDLIRQNSIWIHVRVFQSGVVYYKIDKHKCLKHLGIIRQPERDDQVTPANLFQKKVAARRILFKLPDVVSDLESKAYLQGIKDAFSEINMRLEKEAAENFKQQKRAERIEIYRVLDILKEYGI